MANVQTIEATNCEKGTPFCRTRKYGTVLHCLQKNFFARKTRMVVRTLGKIFSHVFFWQIFRTLCFTIHTFCQNSLHQWWKVKQGFPKTKQQTTLWLHKNGWKERHITQNIFFNQKLYKYWQQWGRWPGASRPSLTFQDQLYQDICKKLAFWLISVRTGLALINLKNKKSRSNVFWIIFVICFPMDQGNKEWFRDQGIGHHGWGWMWGSPSNLKGEIKFIFLFQFCGCFVPTPRPQTPVVFLYPSPKCFIDADWCEQWPWERSGTVFGVKKCLCVPCLPKCWKGQESRAGLPASPFQHVHYFFQIRSGFSATPFFLGKFEVALTGWMNQNEIIESPNENGIS